MLRSGLIATKIGNSSYYYDSGKNSHVTVLKVDECIVSNVKTFDKDGYNAIQLASIETEKDISKIKKPQRKIFSSLKIKPKKGRIVIFPPYFTHTHKGYPPVTNDKYICNCYIGVNGKLLI